jgi:hypothetical protein
VSTSVDSRRLPLTKQQVYTALVEATEQLLDPLNRLRDPDAFAKAERMLRGVFQHAGADAVLDAWITRNLGKRRAGIVRTYYEKWSRNGGKRRA